MADREEVRTVLRKWVSAATVCSPVDGAAAEMLTSRALDELMPLLAPHDQDHRVLATGTTTSWDCGCFHAPDSHRPDCTWTDNPRSLLMVLLPVEPGTGVAVVTRDGDATEAE